MWTKDRREELERLQEVLHGLGRINNGSRFIENLVVIIELAKSLDKADLNNGRSSFMQFLINEAHKED